MTIDSSTYFRELTSSFPDLCANISTDEGNHFNMEHFADYTIAQIKKSDFVELKKCFDFQENKISNISADLENAMTVSYCESLLLGLARETMSDVVKFMGPKLLKIYTDYENYYKNLVTNK